jgi:hypothetical protein
LEESEESEALEESKALEGLIPADPAVMPMLDGVAFHVNATEKEHGHQRNLYVSD